MTDEVKPLQIKIAHIIADCDGTDCLSRAKTIMNMIENTRAPAPRGDARMTSVFSAAIALSREWNREGAKFDEALFAKVEELHTAICSLYGINPVEGFNARDLESLPAPPSAREGGTP